MVSAEEGVKHLFVPDFNQIPWNPVKIRLKSDCPAKVKIWSKSLEIMCFGGYRPCPGRV